jgi:molecular chaperone DnaK
MGKVIGIDLGTTNSVVAVMQGKDADVIVNEEGDRLTPSVVAWTDKGEILVGQIAKRQGMTNPENTVFSAKRFVGRKFEEVAEESRRVPFKVTRAANGDSAIDIRGRTTPPPEVSAHVLRKLKQAAEAFLGEPVTDAVITVPAYFNDSQRQATKDAGKIAGLNVRRIINEPTAAALAYGMQSRKDEVIAVYDFGGGTFDISILEVSESLVEVKSTNGDTHLGGDDVDQRVMEYLIAEFKKSNGIDLGKDKMALQRLRDAAEKAKIELSNVQETTITLPFISAGASGPLHMEVRLGRAQLEQMIEDLVERSFKACKLALDDAKKSPREINEVVLVGGSTRIPMVARRVKEFFGKEPNKSVNPDEVVAVGAAVQGAIMAGDFDKVNGMMLLDVTPLTLGVETKGGIATALIPRNTTIPTSKADTFSTASDNQTQVEIHVLQGERPMARDNKSLGRFVLSGLPLAPQGMPRIRVTFDIDVNGILSVAAKDEASGRDQKITIQAGSGLGKADVERLVREAGEHEAEDRRRREEAENRNKGDALVYQVERMLEQFKEKVPEGDTRRLRDLGAEVRSAIAKQDDAAVVATTEKLQREVHRVSGSLYQDAGGSGGGEGEGAGAGGVGGSGESGTDWHSPGGNGGAAGGAASAGRKGEAIDVEYEDIKPAGNA